MKKHLFLLLFAVSITVTLFSQPICTNCGFGINTALSKIHIKGCGVDSLTSSFRATDSSSNVILFVRDDKRVGINTKYPKSALDITSTTSGILIPRMTKTQRNAISSPATGLLIYQTDNTPGFYYYNGSAWVSSWGITGNPETTASSFLGTTDNVSLRIRTNNTQQVIIDSVGKVGIGTNSPSYKLSLSGTSSIANRTIGINTTPVVYLPDQSGSALEGSIAFGTGLRNLTSGTGKYNTSVGIDALLSNTTGASNTALGYESLKLNTSGDENTVVGFQSLYNNINGTDNSAFGANVLVDNTSGTGNTAIGVYALGSNTEGYDNVALGISALDNNITGFYNTAVGAGTLLYSTTAYNNTAIGNNALYYNTDGIGNVALGGWTLQNNDGGSENVGCGSQALYNNTDGSYNCAVGTNALMSNVDGNYNSASGYQALLDNVSGSSNVAQGYEALESNTGSYNTAIGTRALYQKVGGDYNTTLGYRAGYDVTTGSNNTFLGPFPTTGSGITTGSNNILIGYDVRSGLSQTTSNQLNIGNLIFGTGLGSGNTLSTGNIGIGTSSPVTDARLALKDGHLQSQQTTAPTVAATNAGTSPSVSLSNATDVAGKISLTTGTGSPGTGAYVTVTFNKSYTTAPIVVICPSNANAATNIASKGIYVSSTTTTFVVNFNVAAGTSQTYNWVYHVIETQ